MDSTDINLFLSVARTGSFSNAALDLHLTQSALSKRVKNLEDMIGVDLFIRGKGQKGVELTHAGIEFLELAQRWQGIWQDMRTLRNLQGNQALNIGVLDSVQPLTVRLCHALYERDPGMCIRLQVRSSENMYSEIDKRVIDAGFSHVDRQMPSVKRRYTFSESFVVLCAGDYHAGREEPLAPGDLDPDNEVFVAWWSPGYLAWHANHWEMHHSRRLSTSSVHLQLAFLGTLGKWAILPYALARQACDAGRFTMHRIDPEPPPRVCHLLTHRQPRTATRKTLDQFVECLDSTLRETMPWVTIHAR